MAYNQLGDESHPKFDDDQPRPIASGLWTVGGVILHELVHVDLVEEVVACIRLVCKCGCVLRSAVGGPPAGRFCIPTRWPAPSRSQDLVR